MYRKWIKQCKEDVYDAENGQLQPGAPKKFKNDELESLLDEGPCQTQSELPSAINVHRSNVAMGMIQKGSYRIMGEAEEPDPKQNIHCGIMNCWKHVTIFLAMST